MLRANTEPRAPYAPFSVSLEEALSHTKYDIEENVANVFCEVLGLPQAADRYRIIVCRSTRSANVTVQFHFDGECKAYIDCAYGVMRRPRTRRYRRRNDTDSAKDFSVPLVCDEHNTVVSNVAVLFRRLRI